MQRPSVQKLLAFEKSVQADFAKAARPVSGLAVSDANPSIA